MYDFIDFGDGILDDFEEAVLSGRLTTLNLIIRNHPIFCTIYAPYFVFFLLSKRKYDIYKWLYLIDFEKESIDYIKTTAEIGDLDFLIYIQNTTENICNASVLSTINYIL